MIGKKLLLSLLFLLSIAFTAKASNVSFCSKEQVLGGRTDNSWNNSVGDTYIYPNGNWGLLLRSSKYLNWGSTYGSSGYGLRDNGGAMEWKSSGGSWAEFSSGVIGGSNWTTSTAGLIFPTDYTTRRVVTGGNATTTNDFLQALSGFYANTAKIGTLAKWIYGTSGVLSGTTTIPWGDVANAPTFLTTESDPVWVSASSSYALITGSVASSTQAGHLVVDGTNCSAGNYPLGIDTYGNVQSCTTALTLSNFSALSPLSYNNGTGQFSISEVSTSSPGFMSSSTYSYILAGLGGSTDISGLVPYTGATGNVELGANGLGMSGELRLSNDFTDTGINFTNLANDLNYAVVLSQATSTLTLTSDAVGLGTGGAKLDWSQLLPTMRTFTLPNKNGTFAMTADLITIPYGGTGVTTSVDALNVFLPAQVGEDNKFLMTNGANAIWATATTSAGGGFTELQYNNNGALAGTTGLTWDGAALTLTGDFTLNGALSIVSISGLSNISFSTGNILGSSVASKYYFSKGDGVTDTIFDFSNITVDNRIITVPNRNFTFDTITTNSSSTITGILKANGSSILAAALGDADLILPSQNGNSGKVLKTDGTDASWGSVGAVWGAITGTLSNQTDLQNALNAKQDSLTLGNLTESTSTVLTINGGSNAIIGSGLTLQVKQASGEQSGFLSNTNWTTFNNKESVLTFNAPLSRAANTISIPVSSSTVSGYLSSTDWATFNGKQASLTFGNIMAASSKVSVSGGTGAIIGSGVTVDLGTVSLDHLSDVVIATPATDQIIKYNGTNWVNGTTVMVNAGSGVDYFYTGSADAINGYLQLKRSPSGSEVSTSTEVYTGKSLIQTWITESAVGGEQIDAGVWTMNSWASSTNPMSKIEYNFYSRNISGTETFLFNATTTDNALLPNVSYNSLLSTQASFSITSTDKLVTKLYAIGDGVTTSTVYILYGGQTHYSFIKTPLVIRHNDLASLQGGTSSQYYHLTVVEYTGTGTGNFVRATSPTIVTPTIARLSNLTSNGFIKTINSNGTLTIDTSSYAYATTTINGKALSSNITLDLASSDFANQGTTTTLLHGNAAGNPSWAAVSLTADVSGILGSANGGTGNGFTKFSGAASSEKTFTLPNSSATILTSAAAVTLAQGGTGNALTANHGGIVWSGVSSLQIMAGTTTAGLLLVSGNQATPSWSSVAFPSLVASGSILAANTSNTLTAITSSSGLKILQNSNGTVSWASTSGTGDVVMSVSPTLTTPTINIGGDVLGDIYYRSVGGSLTNLAAGTPFQVLHSGSNPTWGAITENDLSLSDVVTGNVSTSSHGFAPTLPNDNTKYLNGVGNWSVPAGGGGGGSYTPTGKFIGYDTATTTPHYYTYQVSLNNDAVWAVTSSGSCTVGNPDILRYVYGIPGFACSQQRQQSYKLPGIGNISYYSMAETKKLRIQWPMRSVVGIQSAGSYCYALGVTNGLINCNNLSTGAWFKITYGDILEACLGNGTNARCNAISGVTVSNFNVYEMEINGSSVAYYVNGVLKDTISTYYPTSIISYGLSKTFTVSTSTISQRAVWGVPTVSYEMP